MRQRIDPSVEYDRRPVAWGSATVVVLGLVVTFVLGRPGWLVPVAIVGGAVAAARSSFYEPSANNGAIAVTVGTLVLVPALSMARTRQFVGAEGGDAAFYAAVLGLAWLVVLGVLATLGYLSGWTTDIVRRRVGGPIGYRKT